jgi:hypothetical protein
MSAVDRPNLNFDNERKEHVSYSELNKQQPKDMQALYDKLMKAGDIKPHTVRDGQVYNKWFKTK